MEDPRITGFNWYIDNAPKIVLTMGVVTILSILFVAL